MLDTLYWGKRFQCSTVVYSALIVLATTTILFILMIFVCGSLLLMSHDLAFHVMIEIHCVQGSNVVLASNTNLVQSANVLACVWSQNMLTCRSEVSEGAFAFSASRRHAVENIVCWGLSWDNEWLGWVDQWLSLNSGMHTFGVCSMRARGRQA